MSVSQQTGLRFCDNEPHRRSLFMAQSPVSSDIPDVYPIPDGSSIDSDNVIVLYPLRFLVLAILAVGLFCNGAAWMTFSSVTTQSKTYYEVSDSSINWFPNVFLVAYAVEAIPCLFMPKLIGLKWTLLVGCIFNFLGATLRLISLLIPDHTKIVNYGIALSGNVLYGLAMGFLFGIPSLVSSVWFSDKERSISTSTAYMLNAIGVGVGFLDIFLVMGSASSSEDIRKSFLYVAIGEIILNSLVLLSAFIFLKEAPPTPPSQSERRRRNECQGFNLRESIVNTFKDILKMLKHFHSWIAFFIFMTYYGCYTTMFTFLDMIVSTFSPDASSLTGYIGAVGIVLGGINTTAIGFFMTKTKNRFNRHTGSCTNVICAICLLIVTIMAYSGSLTKWAAFVIFVIYLTFCSVCIAVGAEILADITFPIDPNISTNVALILGNAFGASAAALIGLIAGNAKYYTCLILCTVLYVINSVLFLLKTENNRSQIDNKQA